METLLLLNTQNSLNTWNCCGNTDLCLCLGIWNFSPCHEGAYSVLRFDVLLGCFSLLSLRLCFMADWFTVLSISSDFLHLTHLSLADISFFALWLISFHSSLQQLLRAGCCQYCSVSCWIIKQINRRKDSWDPLLWRAGDTSECLAILWNLGYKAGEK